MYLHLLNDSEFWNVCIVNFNARLFLSFTKSLQCLAFLAKMKILKKKFLFPEIYLFIFQVEAADMSKM